MRCAVLLSKMVKSCCCRPTAAGPDFGVTTTSRSMLEGGCCARNAGVHSTGASRRTPKRLRMDMTPLQEGRALSPPSLISYNYDEGSVQKSFERQRINYLRSIQGYPRTRPPRPGTAGRVRGPLRRPHP